MYRNYKLVINGSFSLIFQYMKLSNFVQEPNYGTAAKAIMSSKLSLKTNLSKKGVQ